MMNLALKFTILSAFLVALVLHGDVEQRWVSASDQSAPAAEVEAKPAEVVPAAAPSPRPASPSDTPILALIPETSRDVAATSFASDVLRLSAEADGVDRLWLGYKDKCGVRVSRQYDFGRAWFAVWDRAAEPTVEGSGCGDSLARLRLAGDKLGRGILKARTLARQAGLDRGTEIGMLRWHGLEWSQFEDDHQHPRRSDLAVAASGGPAPLIPASAKVALEP